MATDMAIIIMAMVQTTMAVVIIAAEDALVAKTVPAIQILLLVAPPEQVKAFQFPEQRLQQAVLQYEYRSSQTFRS